MGLPSILPILPIVAVRLGTRDLERDLGLRRRRATGQIGLGRSSDRIMPEPALRPAALDRFSA